MWHDDRNALKAGTCRFHIDDLHYGQRGAGIRRLYHTWFGRYGEPLSPIVEAMYEFQAVGE
jgi:hypothetical protein